MSRSVRRGGWAWCLLVAALWSHAALASAVAPTEPAQTTVAIVTEPGMEGLTGRLRAELGTLRLDVVTARAPADREPFMALPQLARRLDVAAAIWIRTDPGTVTVWISDRVTGKTSSRTSAIPAGEDPDQVIALRAVELLRASLRELETNRRPAGAEVPASSKTRALTRPPAPRFAFDVGPAIAGSSGGVGPSVHAAVGARWLPHPYIGLGLRAIIPTVGPEVSGPEGLARVAVSIVDVGPRFGLVKPWNRWQPDLGAAVGVAILRMDGVARAPFESATDHVVTASLRVRGGLSVALTGRVRLRVDGSVGVLLPRAGIQFGDRQAATWGQPYGLGWLAVEVVFE